MTRKLPARFVDNRIFLHPRTVAGHELTFYSDTGGGNMFIRPDTVRRLGLTVRKQADDTGRSFDFAEPPAFANDASLPMGVHVDGFFLADEWLDRRGWDGFLGQTWFADRVWRFDYLRHELALLDPEDARPGLLDHPCPLAFQALPDGRRALHFPRISAEIDGDHLEFLFDTGAMAALTPHGQEALAGASGPCPATSFITRTVFEGWRARHPDWRTIDRADATADEAMILVPLVRVAGHGVGPVWFTRRDDANFSQNGMSQLMDRRIDGALGGSLFQYFRVTVDYPGAMAYFHRPS